LHPTILSIGRREDIAAEEVHLPVVEELWVGLRIKSVDSRIRIIGRREELMRNL
jgi:hypothetical protein